MWVVDENLSPSEGHDCGESYCEGSFGVHTAACSADQDTARVSNKTVTKSQLDFVFRGFWYSTFSIRHILKETISNFFLNFVCHFFCYIAAKS